MSRKVIFSYVLFAITVFVVDLSLYYFKYGHIVEDEVRNVFHTLVLAAIIVIPIQLYLNRSKSDDYDDE